MKKLPTVSIGIPAYNEEANIKHLLQSLLAQKTDGLKLEKIIIVSDGSIDKTNSLVKSFKNEKIKLFQNKSRLGLNQSQNFILKNVNSDILVLLDADILPQNTTFLKKIIEPLINNHTIGLVSCKLYGIRASSLYARVITNSTEMKRHIYQDLPNPNNIYLCNGRARAFSKEFFTKLNWPDDVPEDAYSYLFAKTSGFKFIYLHDPILYFYPPGNIDDHVRQNKRFIGGKKSLEKYFDKDLLRREYIIPVTVLMKYILIYLYKRPFSTPAYLLMMFYILIFNKKKVSDHSRYEISKSSKKIVGVKHL